MFVLDQFEETRISNNKLPESWQSQESLDGLAEFLQQNWEQRSALFNDGQTTSVQQYIEFLAQGKIRTKNYIGTIVYKGDKLNIYPKMFREDDEDNETDELDVKHMMSNLVQWLEYCTKIDYPYLNINTEIDSTTDLRDLFITLYVRYVKSALERGLFFKYEDQEDNCTTIKGKVDLKDYYLRKYPQGNLTTFKCRYSTFEFDNKLNRIIKFVCKSLINETSKKTQKDIRLILNKLNEVSDVRCVPSDCDKIRLNNLQTHYRIILSLSKMFLLNKTSTYNLDKTESLCFLFPTEVLFEGFIGGFMQDVLKGDAIVKLQESSESVFNDVIYKGQSLGRALQMKHDIFVEHKTKGIFILDTKYKRIKRFDGSSDVRDRVNSEASSSDIYQILTYARKRGAKDVYLLYPLFRKEDIEPDNPISVSKKEDGSEPINVHLVRLPFVFEDNIEETKEKLKKVILDIFK